MYTSQGACPIVHAHLEDLRSAQTKPHVNPCRNHQNYPKTQTDGWTDKQVFQLYMVS